MNRRQATLRHHIAAAFIIPTVFVGAAAAFILTGADQSATVEEPNTSSPVTRIAEGSPAALIAEHDCWTGDAPADMAGKVPGGVVVTKGARTFYGGPRMVRLALEQVFDGDDHDLTVHAFCRGGGIR